MRRPGAFTARAEGGRGNASPLRRSRILRNRLLLPALAGDGDAGWGRGLVGNEEGGRERLARIDTIAIEIGDALAVEKAVVDQEIAGEGLRRLCEDAVRRFRHDLRGPRHAHHALAAEE